MIAWRQTARQVLYSLLRVIERNRKGRILSGNTFAFLDPSRALLAIGIKDDEIVLLNNKFQPVMYGNLQRLFILHNILKLSIIDRADITVLDVIPVHPGHEVLNFHG